MVAIGRNMDPQPSEQEREQRLVSRSEVIRSLGAVPARSGRPVAQLIEEYLSQQSKSDKAARIDADTRNTIDATEQLIHSF